MARIWKPWGWNPMWEADESKLVLVWLHDRGKRVETAWAEDLSEVPGQRGKRRVRMANVLFDHDKPTYGDVIVVERALPSGLFTWNALGNPRAHLDVDDGRYLMVVEYRSASDTVDDLTAYRRFRLAGDEADIVIEGCEGPSKKRPGWVTMAVPYRLNPFAVMRYFRGRRLPVSLEVIYVAKERFPATRPRPSRKLAAPSRRGMSAPPAIP